MLGNLSHSVSEDRIHAACKAYGLQKQLAHQLGVSDTELSRMLNEQVPKLCVLIEALGMELVDSEYLASIRKVLKETL